MFIRPGMGKAIFIHICALQSSVAGQPFVVFPCKTYGKCPKILFSSFSSKITYAAMQNPDQTASEEAV